MPRNSRQKLEAHTGIWLNDLGLASARRGDLVDHLAFEGSKASDLVISCPSFCCSCYSNTRWLGAGTSSLGCDFKRVDSLCMSTLQV